MSTIKFVNLGETDASNLNFHSPIIYNSESLISSMSYSGSADKIKESTTFTDSFKKKLIGIQGMVSLGSTNGMLRNVHIYSRNAIRLDGVERLCYLQQEDNKLIVSEYSGNRGAKYSALYRILTDELYKAGFIDIQGKFKLSEADITKFVEVVNFVIDQRETNSYDLIAIQDVDVVVIEKKRYYYFKAYWRPKSSTCQSSSEVSEENVILINNVDQSLKDIIEYLKNCNDIRKLDELKVKIDKLSDIILGRIKHIEEVDKLSSEL